MNTSRKLKIWVFGSGLIVLMIALRLITSFTGHRRIDSSETVPGMKESEQPTHVDKITTWRKGQAPADIPRPVPQPETVSITYDLRSEREAELIGKMNYALTNSTTPIVADQRTLKKLVLARIKGDWSTVPKGPDWADNEMWQHHSANRLKQEIGYLLPTGTNEVQVDTENGMTTQIVIVPAEPDTIRRVLEVDVGTTVPPMEDYEIHE